MLEDNGKLANGSDSFSGGLVAAGRSKSCWRREGNFPMRKLSVLAIFLAISVACSQQTAATGPPPTGTNSKATDSVDPRGEFVGDVFSAQRRRAVEASALDERFEAKVGRGVEPLEAGQQVVRHHRRQRDRDQQG